MQLNLRQIEVFRAVMSTGSISGAAKLLFVSQPAVSRTLSHMEQRLGFPLFERVKGRLYATPEAKSMFREVEIVYNGVRRVSELATELAERRAGILHLVSSPSIGHMLVPMAITRFHNIRPEVKVTFQPLTLHPMTQMLLEGRAELGAMIVPTDHPNLLSRTIGKGELVCICPYDHELARRAVLEISDLKPYSLIAYSPDSQFGILIASLYQREQQPLKVSIEVSSPLNACALVKAGAGISIVDEFSARSSKGDFVIRPIRNTTKLMINLVQSRFEPISQLAQDFVKCLQETVDQSGFSLHESDLMHDRPPSP
ncbi:LysR family transcriptional regulator [Orrella marina]|uniref:LysR family transcriptional regulator n=1 Tax=Orrella marina TaxID=2163011 RepID=A0A2R4XJB9_9BURK|nr:LysR family transcriptional regulator [Orrella marina]AWB33890.1 LysR family transcriptional regulator [Orrella marina]